MINTILFDLDGTLVHHGHVLLPEKLVEWGHPRSLDEVKQAFHDQIRWAYDQLNGNKEAGYSSLFWQGFYQRILGQMGISDDSLSSRMVAFFAADPVPPLFEDVAPLLERLQGSSWRLGVITQRPRRGVIRFLDAHGLSVRFPVVVAGDDGFGRKPDPEPFFNALARLGTTPEQAVFVGDRVDDDCGGACNAGLRAFLIDREGFYGEESGWSLNDRSGNRTEFIRLTSLVELLDHLSVPSSPS
jgi:HAD superfamily hydrolase (TIGR01549 family)